MKLGRKTIGKWSHSHKFVVIKYKVYTLNLHNRLGKFTGSFMIYGMNEKKRFRDLIKNRAFKNSDFNLQGKT